MPPLSIYIHVPFCQRKCHYCDFNTYAGIDHLIPPYVDALLTEVRNWAGLAEGHRVTTVFLGGGTPSLLSGAQMQAVLDACRTSFSLVPGPEITIEANPGTVSPGKLEQYQKAGVNRISFGAQSFDPGELAWLGRIHSEAQVAEAVAQARQAGFQRLNLDLIYGLPGQSTARWEANVGQALSLGPEHLSLYALSVEEGTPLAGWVASGRTPEPDPDVAADHYLAADAMLSAAGFDNYEISNWARPGEACRHNLTYWENRPYLGLGAGAHGCFGGFRYHNVLLPQEYIQRLSANNAASNTRRRPFIDMAGRMAASSPVAGINRVEPAEDLLDTLTLGLRLARGIGFDDFQTRHDVDLRDLYRTVIAETEALGLLLER
ncbi:MAG: radical SAM family heme chaperone HemW, partial [Chloroflexota bacterium]